MKKNTKSTLTDKSEIQNLPKKSASTKNKTPNTDTTKENVAWRTIPDIGSGS